MKTTQEYRVSIGQLAKATGLSSATLRFYESLKLIGSLARGTGGPRYFPPATVDILTAISHFQKMGFTLREILKLTELPVAHNTHRGRFRTMLKSKLAQVDVELKEGRRKKEILSRAFQHTARPSKPCNCELQGLLKHHRTETQSTR